MKRYMKSALSVKNFSPVMRGCRSDNRGKKNLKRASNIRGMLHISKGLSLNAVINSPCSKACIIR